MLFIQKYSLFFKCKKIGTSENRWDWESVCVFPEVAIYGYVYEDFFNNVDRSPKYHVKKDLLFIVYFRSIFQKKSTSLFKVITNRNL